ncbi:Dihydropteroate synthase-like protein [Lactarius quietus]|nr:Dihydropteroate synthase-like protein [Lactarius quietus]
MADATVSSPASSAAHPLESHSPKDTIRIRNLLLLARIADGAQWPSATLAPVRQPVRVSVSIPYDLRPAAAGDDISKSINYGSLSKRILASVEDPVSEFGSLDYFLDHIFLTCFGAFPEIQEMTVDVVKPRALPYAEGVRILSSRARDGFRLAPDRLSIQRLSCNLIVGLNPCEREDKQLVYFDVDISTARGPGSGIDFRQLAKEIHQEVESSEFISLESLACLTARITLRHANKHDNIVTVRAAKPKALVFADAAEVEIVRTPQDYLAVTGVGTTARAEPPTNLDPPIVLHSLTFLAQGVASDLDSSVRSPLWKQHHLAAIALGSNLGDRFANIEAALRLMERPGDVSTLQESGTPSSLTIMNTSFLYETAPMYVTDQPSFLNCACVIKTTMSPTTLLEILKGIEHAVGRVASIRNGPRAVDLDILFYDNELIDTRPESLKGALEALDGHLVIPHPRISEREFVLRPLDDMIPDFVHPALHKPIREMLSDVLRASSAGSPAMIKVMPFPAYPRSTDRAPPVASVPDVPHTRTYWTFPPAGPFVPHGQVSTPRHTRLMATLNVTPDSFSDGADHTALPDALAYTASAVRTGAHIIDVGGYSTRPGAAHVTPEDEIARVVPVIEGIHAFRSGTSGAGDLLISVDTFRPDVARAAVLAGANCINDVHAFTGPDYPLTSSSSSPAAYFAGMKGAARELAVPVVLMHSRGDAGANQDYSRYSSVVRGVVQELGEKVDAIVRGSGGVRRWLVMIDPGIGFSKSVDDNLEVLRNSASITAEARTALGGWNPLRGHPLLIGASRKSFLGKLLSQPDRSGTYEGRETTPKERGWPTAAAVASAVQQGAAVVRVHDVLEMGDVVRVANAIWE